MSDSLFSENFLTNTVLEPERWKAREGRLKQLGPDDVCLVKMHTRKLLRIGQKWDIKSQSFNIIGIDIYPQYLSVFASQIINELGGTNNRSKAQCIFYIRDSFLGTDLKVEISLPGGTKLYVCDQEGEARDVRTEDLDRCYLSSVLRYMRALDCPQQISTKGPMVDPFHTDRDQFYHFLSTLCRVTRDYDIDLQEPYSYDELNISYKTALRIVATYVRQRKLHVWMKDYYLTHEIDAGCCLKKSPHLVQFYLQIFLNSEQRLIVAQLLYHQDIGQHLAQPVRQYYLSRLTKKKDDQISLLKSICYTNKTEIWIGLAHCYLNNRYTNFGMLSKAMLIMNHLAKKEDQQSVPINPLRYEHRPLPFKRRLEYMPEILVYPQRFRSLLDRNAKLGKESQNAQSSLVALGSHMEKYFQLSPLYRQIVGRLSKILKAVGLDKFCKLYAQTFEPFPINIDSIDLKLVRPTDPPIEKEVAIDLESEYEHIPSFVSVDLQGNILHKQQSQSTNMPMDRLEDVDELARIAQQTQLSEREYKKNLQQIEIINTKILEQQAAKRYIHPKMKELVELSIDIRRTIDEIGKKLSIDFVKVETLRNLLLPLDHSMIFYEGAILCGHLLTSAYILLSIKKRIADLYTYHRLFKVLVELKDFSGFINQLGELVKDLKAIGVTNITQLPLWAEQQLFNAIDRKGRIFIETLIKNSAGKDESMLNSVVRYQQLYPKK